MIDETVAEIQAMETHSSSVVVVKAAEALGELLDRDYDSLESFERDVEHNAGALRRSNPSHASMHGALREVEQRVIGEASTVAEARKLLNTTIQETISEVRSGKREAAARAAGILDDGETFVTHDYSSTVLEAVRQAAATGAELTAHVTEARPRYLGRKAARRFVNIEGVTPHLFVDSAMAHALADADRVLLGMTCVTDDTYYNRVGTYPLIATAAQQNVPVTVVGSSAKVVGGFRFQNEYRKAVEVSREPIEDVAIENPAYDEAPMELIEQVITDQGTTEV
ncbi:MAG: translation initiation factor 2B subunit II family (IF-2BII) [uncultured archaeon A07HR60]|nr:MAG: translation initiation factor 2B subunit II family (IF-2BII) [uncultured archaeon A07HR60]